VLLRELPDVLDLAASEQRRRVTLLALLDQAADDRRAGALGQEAQLSDGRLGSGAGFFADR